MITDRLQNSALYHALHPRLAMALGWLSQGGLASLPLGKTVIDGEDVFALVQEYLPKDAGRLEAHRVYWDVQLVLSGEEQMGWLNIAMAVESEAYDADSDVAFFTGPASFFRVPAGSFAIFGPQDVHMPGMAVAGPSSAGLVRKIVVKVRLDAV
jgi:biofilm protein TabA